MINKLCYYFLLSSVLIGTNANCSSTNSIDISGSPEKGFVVKATLGNCNVNSSGLDQSDVLATLKLIKEIGSLQLDGISTPTKSRKKVSYKSQVTVTSTTSSPAKGPKPPIAPKPIKALEGKGAVLDELLYRSKKGFGLKPTVTQPQYVSPNLFDAARERIRRAVVGDDENEEWSNNLSDSQTVVINKILTTENVDNSEESDEGSYLQLI